MNTTTLRRLQILALSLGASALLACATSPPDQLVAARDAYRSAAAGPASTSAPDELQEAQKALARAEQSYAGDGDDTEVTDLAYVAARRAELATVIANRRVAERRAEDLHEQRQRLSEQLRQEAAKELVATKDALEEASRRTQDATEAKIQAEREADAARAEARATKEQMKEAREKLARWAEMVETRRGTVITLSSGILFATAKADVLAGASGRLDDVARYLQQSPERRVRVEGHTDTAGGSSYNQSLSQARADAVRSYLVTHGVSPTRITAVGFGETRPVATNDTVEGRANNRRVEIVLEPLPAPVPPPVSDSPPPIPDEGE